MKITEPLLEFDPAEVDAAIDELYEVVLAEIAERRREPREDLLTGLALAQDEEGSTLSDDKLVSVAGIIMIAGHETTASIIASSIVHLYRNPDQLAMIRDRPELWPNAVEELLRYDTALAADPRTALEDFELAGHAIRKGQNIVVLNYYANRDLRRWPDGDELRLDRDNPSGLSFGHEDPLLPGRQLGAGRDQGRVATAARGARRLHDRPDPARMAPLVNPPGPQDRPNQARELRTSPAKVETLPLCRTARSPLKIHRCVGDTFALHKSQSLSPVTR